MRKTLAVLSLVAIAFGWGFLSHRNSIFPYGLLRQFFAPQYETRSLRSNAAQLASLRSLPYLSSAPNSQGTESGVLMQDKARAFKGYTLYAPRNRPSAVLLDMDGLPVWEWQENGRDGWLHTELLPDGDLLVLVSDKYVQRLDADSNLLWRYETKAHHDLWIKGNVVWVLDRENRIVPALHESTPVTVDKITLLDLDDGRKLGEIDLLDILLESPYSFLLQSISHEMFEGDEALDLLHTNHVEVFDGSLSSQSNLFREGNVLLSMRNINTIAIFDPETLSIEWLWGPSNLTLQHHPTLLRNGNFLIFDNGLKKSKVLELDPIARKVVWEYKDPTFFSATRGSVQRLPNGNTLITESDTGRIFEVTSSGDRVWEFANPVVDKEGNRAAIWRARRFAENELPWMHDKDFYSGRVSR